VNGLYSRVACAKTQFAAAVAASGDARFLEFAAGLSGFLHAGSSKRALGRGL
jgi:hypothetical protein